MRRQQLLLAFIAMMLHCSAAAPWLSAANAGLSAEEIVRRSVEANERDWRAANEYSFTQTTRDSNGAKTESVTMLFGSPYRRLVKRGGKPISSEEDRREGEKFQEAVSQRRSESAEARKSRIAEYEQGRRRDHLMMEQLTAAFTFNRTGRGRLSGRNVYILRATPRPNYRPPNIESRVLTGMKGTLWIDEKTFQWVKVLAQVISPVTIGGFLATVQP